MMTEESPDAITCQFSFFSPEPQGQKTESKVERRWCFRREFIDRWIDGQTGT